MKPRRGRNTVTAAQLEKKRHDMAEMAAQTRASRQQHAVRWARDHDFHDWWRRYQVAGDLDDADVGCLHLRHFDVPPGDPARVDYMVEGGEDRDPGSGRFVKLTDARLSQGPWMSDTRAEILELMPLITRLRSSQVLQVKPSVLITGLGLGMAVKAALAHGASRVDVIELDPDVVVMSGGQFAHDPRVSIQVGDAFAAAMPKGVRWDLAWHDIWPTITDLNLPGMRRLRARFTNRAGWQGCWQEDGARHMASMMKLVDQYEQTVGPVVPGGHKLRAAGRCVFDGCPAQASHKVRLGLQVVDRTVPQAVMVCGEHFDLMMRAG